MDEEQNAKQEADRVFEENKDKFEGATGLSFSRALVELKDGRRIARTGWNGKGMWVVYQKAYPDGIPINKNTEELRGHVSEMRIDGSGRRIGSDSRGYYWCREAWELDATLHHISGRASRLYRVEQAIKEAQRELQGVQIRLL